MPGFHRPASERWASGGVASRRLLLRTSPSLLSRSLSLLSRSRQFPDGRGGWRSEDTTRGLLLIPRRPRPTVRRAKSSASLNNGTPGGLILRLARDCQEERADGRRPPLDGQPVAVAGVDHVSAPTYGPEGHGSRVSRPALSERSALARRESARGDPSGRRRRGRPCPPGARRPDRHEFYGRRGRDHAARRPGPRSGSLFDHDLRGRGRLARRAGRGGRASGHRRASHVTRPSNLPLG